MMARTRWMFGFQRRLVRRWEWLTLMPKDGCFPHTSQTAAMAHNLIHVGPAIGTGSRDPERLPAPFPEPPTRDPAPVTTYHPRRWEP